MRKGLLGFLLVCAAAALFSAPAFASQSPFFLDSRGQLWAATDTSGKTFLFTGASGKQLSTGTVSTFGGIEIAVVRTAKNRVQIFNGGNNVVTKTGVAARDVVAGRGAVFIRRPDNKIAIITLGALKPDGTFDFTVTNTNARAVQMSLGYDTGGTRDFLAFRRPDRRVRMMEVVGGVPVFGTSAVKAIDIVAGNQKETFVRKPDNRIAVLTIDTATASGVTFAATKQSNRKAVEMSVSRNNPSGSDYLAFRAPNGSVHFANYVPTGPAMSFVAVPGGLAKQVVAGVTEIFIRRPNDRVQYFTLNGAGTGIAATVTTGAFANRLFVTRFTLGPGVIDQVAILKKGRLFVSQNDGPGSAIASFYNTGFYAKAVAGYTRSP